MRQNILQKLGNPVAKFLFKEPKNNLEDERAKNLACKSALESIDKSSKKLKHKEKDLKRVIDRYGQNRVSHLLSNSTKFRKEDEVLNENLAWSRKCQSFGYTNQYERSDEYAKAFIPDTSKDFNLVVSGACLNWMIEEVGELEKSKNFLDFTQIESDSLSEVEQGAILVLSPTALASPFAQQKSQLWMALEDSVDGEKIKARNLSSGVEMELDSSMVLGVAKEEYIPEWASKKQNILMEQLEESLTPEQMLFENGKPFLGPSLKNYRTISMQNDVLLVAEQTKSDNIKFSTWVMENNKPSKKHDFSDDLDSAKRDFGLRSGITKDVPILSFEEFRAAKEKAETTVVRLPNLSEEESNIYLKLCQKINTPTSQKQQEELVDEIVNDMESESENVNEWTEYQETHYNYPEEQSTGYGNIDEYQQFEEEEQTQGKDPKLLYMPIGPDQTIFDSGKDFEFPVKSNSKIISQKGDIALVATKAENNEIKYAICDVDQQKQRVTPITSMTNDYSVAEQNFKEKTVDISMGPTTNISTLEKMAILNACCFALEQAQNIPMEESSVLQDLVNRFSVEEVVYTEELVSGDEFCQ